jgi:hypothetical protein
LAVNEVLDLEQFRTHESRREINRRTPNVQCSTSNAQRSGREVRKDFARRWRPRSECVSSRISARLSEHGRDFQTGIARRFFASPPSARPRSIDLFAIGQEFRLGPSSMHELR